MATTMGALMACGAGSSGTGDAPEATGTAVAAVGLPPAGVSCLSVQVVGATTVTKSYELTPDMSTTFELTGLPLGTDTFSATALPVPCADAGATAPTWSSQPVVATVSASPPVAVSLAMHPVGPAQPDGGAAMVGVSFSPSPCQPIVHEFTIPGTGRTPYAIAPGPDGNLWFTDNGAIGVISPTGGAASIQEFSLSVDGGSSAARAIAAGPDGNVWFNHPAGGLGVITPGQGASSIKEFVLPSTSTTGAFPVGIAAGPDGNMWFTEAPTSALGSITPGSGVIQEIAFPTSGTFGLVSMAAGPDGNLWFVEAGGNSVGTINPKSGAASIKTFALPTPGGAPWAIAPGPDGNMWFAESGGNRIGFISPTGGASSIQEIALIGSPNPVAIVGGPDGNVWFAEANAGKIGVLTPGGGASSLREFAVPTPQAQPAGIAVGPDGNIWFTELAAGKIGSMTPYTVCPDAGAADAAAGG
jgi:virginiamycin B lyase